MGIKNLDPSKFRFSTITISVIFWTGGKNSLDYLEKKYGNIIKIMPCVEGDRSDCQPEASSTAQSRRLREVVVVEG